MIGKANITINCSGKAEVQKIGDLLQNLADKVSEKDLLNLSKKVEKNPNFFKKIVKALDNPIVQNFFK